MPTTPPTLDPSPQVPQRGVKSTFGPLVDAFNTWISAAVSKFAAVATNVYNNAVEAFNSATTASAAATTATDARDVVIATANATVWVSGQTVAQYANKISPLDHQTYRRKTATGAGTTDPSLDATNYVAVLPLVRAFQSADQAYTANGTLTIAHGLGVAPKYVLPFCRDTSNGKVYGASPASDTASGSTIGAQLSWDATNIYVGYGSSSVMNGYVSAANAAFFVRAFV